MLSGLIIFLFTKYILIFLDLDLGIQISDTFQLLIISYFIGLIFQEIGSNLNCWRLLISIYKPIDDLHVSLSQQEVEFLMEEAHSKLGFENAEDHLIEIYNFCKTKSNNNLDSDRKQSLSGMARSLMIYFWIVSCMLIAGFFTTQACKYLVSLFLCLCFAWLFYNRYKRFLKMKYVNVFRNYYYSRIPH